MRWSSLSIWTKILLVNLAVALLSAAFLVFVLYKLRINAGNMEDQAISMSTQETLLSQQHGQITGQFALLAQQAQLQSERERAEVRHGLVRDATAHFLQHSYWLTDLALTMQNDSERIAKQHHEALMKILAALAASDAAGVAALKPLVEDFSRIMMEAVDSYVDENRVKGNSLSAQARAKAALTIKHLEALGEQIDVQNRDANLRLADLNARIGAAGAEVLAAGKLVEAARAKVSSATTGIISANHGLQGSTLISMFVGFAFAAVASWLFARTLTRRTRQTLHLLEAVATGDLKQRQAIDSQDEIGRMAQALNTTLDTLRDALHAIAGDSKSLTASAQNLQGVSQRLDVDLATTSRESIGAASAARLVSDNMTSLSAGVQEMNASIDEISKNAHAAAGVAAGAVEVVATTIAAVGQLSEASSAIGEIAKVISGIAAQTNLLALNATIEAARAGEAGKGFAVVASEVKSLAGQTAAATEDINKRIAAIQAGSTRTREAIDQIGAVIRQVNEFQQSIASAVEEQAATTKEIAGNISQAAEGSSEISAKIAAVVAITERTCADSAHTREASLVLDHLAGDLAAVAGKFSC